MSPRRDVRQLLFQYPERDAVRVGVFHACRVSVATGAIAFMKPSCRPQSPE
jgi:hypothetical protein